MQNQKIIQVARTAVMSASGVLPPANKDMSSKLGLAYKKKQERDNENINYEEVIQEYRATTYVKGVGGKGAKRSLGGAMMMGFEGDDGGARQQGLNDVCFMDTSNLANGNGNNNTSRKKSRGGGGGNYFTNGPYEIMAAGAAGTTTSRTASTKSGQSKNGPTGTRKSARNANAQSDNQLPSPFPSPQKGEGGNQLNSNDKETYTQKVLEEVGAEEVRIN